MENNSTAPKPVALEIAIQKIWRQSAFHGIIHGYLFRNYLRIEGSASFDELHYLQNLVRKSKGKKVLEIGFNAGFSSYAMLEADPAAEVVSFDLGSHPYTKIAKKFVDRNFPGRHTLICGDSTETVPRFAEKHPDVQFGVAFVDGGHEYETAKNDLLNIRPLCTKETFVVIDDLAPWLKWGEGPTRVWQEAIDAKIIRQVELFMNGRPVERAEPPSTQIWAMGKFV